MGEAYRSGGIPQSTTTMGQAGQQRPKPTSVFIKKTPVKTGKKTGPPAVAGRHNLGEEKETDWRIKLNIKKDKTEHK
jgi:hypothetical protein